MTKNKFLKNIKLALYLLTIAGIAVFLYFRKDDLAKIIELSFVDFILLLVVGLVSQFINALLFRNNIKIFGLDLPFLEWFGLTITNTMYNYLLPARGGLAIRAVYLKKCYDFNYSHYISFTAGVFLLNLIIASFIAIISSIYLLLTNKLQSLLILVAALSVFVILLIAVFIIFRIDSGTLRHENRITSVLKKISSGINQFQHHKTKIIILAIIQTIFIFSLSLRLYVAYQIIGIQVDFIILILINSFVAFSMIISITPGNLGIKEGLIGISSSLLLISTETAILGAIIDRVMAILIIFSFGLIYSNKLLKKMPVSID